MAAQLSTPTPRTIRVYCPSHKVGFSAAATATIECSTATHTLAHDFPSESFWEYCCDCQHYWPIDAAKGNKGSDDCPVCERHIDRRALCAECKVLSVESNDAAKRKAFSITTKGLVSPACPGCLRQTNRAVLEHSCPDFGYVFVTTREVCPFCDERLEPPPSFPCSVAAYLEKLPRSAFAVRFQPDKSLLTQAKKGEYFLIPLARESTLSIVIPGSTRLGSKQDYYNSYYELFNCENPVPGEVMIVTPAVVEAVEGGWQLRETGFIEIKADPVPEVETVPTDAVITCGNCGELGHTGQTFCKHCGSPLRDALPLFLAALLVHDLSEGPRRFSELEHACPGISPRTLSERLRWLEAEGVLERRSYPESPPRVEYELTGKGQALLPIISEMRRFGHEWLGCGAHQPADARPAAV